MATCLKGSWVFFCFVISRPLKFDLLGTPGVFRDEVVTAASQAPNNTPCVLGLGTRVKSVTCGGVKVCDDSHPLSAGEISAPFAQV